MRAIDLFAGAGGLSLGLIEAGIDVVAAVEWDHDAAETYRLNIGDHMIEADITTIDPDDLPAFDLIAGGPPCQGFSHAGKRDPNDPRNKLWEHYLRIVDAKRPAFVLIENVPGILRSAEHHGIVNALTELGYHVSHYRLCAADFGVPQRRYRVFYVANSIGIANPVPAPTHVASRHGQMPMGYQPWVTVRQALGIGGVLAADPDHPERERSVDEPAATVNTGSRTDHIPAIMALLDEPSGVIRSGAHGAPGYSPRHQAGYVSDVILDALSVSITTMAGNNAHPDRMESLGLVRPAGYIPNIPLDEPSPTILGGASGDGSGHTGGPEPVRHTLKNRYAEHGDGSGPDEPAPTVSADRGLEHHWLADHYDVAPTIQADSRVSQPGHHGEGEPRMMLRRLTPEECAILQDFPPAFVFTGSKTSKHRQIGNAVPRGLARAIGEVIRQAWEAAV